MPSQSAANARKSTRPAPAGRAGDIMDAALTLFAERGYLGTSMRDIASQLGMRAPSLYNHLESKQELLQDIMLRTMENLVADHQMAVATTNDVAEQLRRAMEAHVRYHARHPREVRIGNAEIWNLEQPAQDRVRKLRRDYARSWQDVINRGVDEGRFQTPSPQLASYAMLEMGIGISLWYHEGGRLSESQLAYYYGDMALRLVSAESG
ncbi:TetR/AcrR family transcriptional regulator [Streptomyces brasiliensis]|uniref:TetR family transcriptional regulator n=1 Tax=Streptomyces brasiliensis TaxID=1954 RepID=A0A917KXW3_9ACTN|nr:TetR/AcrR family transcriptional regulator [Streptomyces brasiliensis]GGJ35139.1 TetR family transcriptional regulator [Streptomyces brasiliensis]